MKQKTKRLWKTIENWGEKGVGGTHYKGYMWLNRTFLPALKRAENDELTSERKMYLADAYYVLGDIHDFNDAPRAAIKAYSKSIALYPSSGAWREIGGMQANIGNRLEAIKCLETALSIDPEDEYAISDLEYIKDDHIDSQLFKEGDIFWDVRELLAKDAIDDALILLKKNNSLSAILHRARVYGAKGDDSGYLRELEKIKSKKKRFKLEWGDWFYLPNKLWDSGAFWKLLIEFLPRLKPGVAPSDGSLALNYYKELNKNQNKNNESKTVKLTFLFHYYRCTKNYKKILQLSKKYPKWKEPAKELKTMAT